MREQGLGPSREGQELTRRFVLMQNFIDKPLTAAKLAGILFPVTLPNLSESINQRRFIG